MFSVRLIMLALLSVLLPCTQVRAWDQNIRVLLQKFDISSSQQFTVSSERGLFLSRSPHDTKPILLPQETLKVLIKEDSFYAAGKSNKFRRIRRDQLHLKPARPEDTLTFNGSPYEGTLSLVLTDDGREAMLINTLHLENYLYSVLRYETFQSWPLEMHKVQAIASRSYAVARIHQNRRRNKGGKPFDIKRTNCHQTYLGTHPYSHLKKALEETEGKILTHDGNVVTAMFDSCCGGIIPLHMEHHDFEKAPYLGRATPCIYCRDCKLYSWEKELAPDHIYRHLSNYRPLKRHLEKVGPIRNVHVTKRDRAGIVHDMVLLGLHSTLMLKGDHLQNSLKGLLRSMHFTVERDGDRFKVSGRGFGHLTGLCQYGARELVRRGWRAENILAFYYPRTALARLS